MKPLHSICLLLLLAAGCAKEPTGNNARAVFTDKRFEYYCVNNRHLNPHRHEYLTVEDVRAVREIDFHDSPASVLDEVQTLNDLRLFENVEKITFTFDLRHISQMDLTTLSKLRQLDLTIGSFTELDLSGNPRLDSLDCSFNPITQLDLSRNPRMKWLDVAGTEISGIELTHLPALEHLSFSYTPLTSLDLSGNPKLGFLTFDRCKIQQVDFSHNPRLSYLSCDESWIERLDLGTCRRLSNVNAMKCNFLTTIHANKLTKKSARIFADEHTGIYWVEDPGASVGPDDCIDFPDYKFEEYLLEAGYDTDADGRISRAEAAKITRIETKERNFISLDGIQYMPNLSVLISTQNSISEIDMSRNENLKMAVLTACKLETLNASGCKLLTTLLCAENELTQLRPEECPALEALDASNNGLIELDTRANARLRSLSCSNNQIGDLKVTSTFLETLNCRNNGLYTLNVSQASALISLDCGRNYISELDLRSNRALQTLDTSGCYWLDVIRLAPGQTLIALEKEDFTRVVYE